MTLWIMVQILHICWVLAITKCKSLWDFMSPSIGLYKFLFLGPYNYGTFISFFQVMWLSRNNALQWSWRRECQCSRRPFSKLPYYVLCMYSYCYSTFVFHITIILYFSIENSGKYLLVLKDVISWSALYLFPFMLMFMLFDWCPSEYR